jgi:hypothetical protein
VKLNDLMSVHALIRRLPGIAELQDRSVAMAVLDAVLVPEWQYRYFSFDAGWAPGEQMASMRNGSGDDYFIVFAPAGVYARGFDHESPMSPYGTTPPTPWPGLFDGLPDSLRAQITEPAFCDPSGMPMATVCFWRGAEDAVWSCGAVEIPGRDKGNADGAGFADDADGAERMFDVLADGRPQAYCSFAEDHYEVDVDLDAVRHVYALRPLTPDIIAALNPHADPAAVEADCIDIGYPVVGP